MNPRSLDIQIDEVSMLEALNDVVVSQSAKERIQKEYAGCEAKEGQAKVECFIEAGKRTERILEEEYRDTVFWSPGVQRLWSRVEEITQKVASNYEGNPNTEINPLVNIFLQVVVQTTVVTKSNPAPIILKDSLDINHPSWEKINDTHSL